MEFPFGHQHTHHHHHHQRDDEEENRERPSYPPPACQEPPFGAPPSDPPPPYFQEPRFGAPPPPPPSYYQETEFVPPPLPPPTHVYHSSDRPEEFASVNCHPPAPTPVTHVAHEVNEGRVESTESHHSYRPHLPSFLHHQSHSGSGSGSDLSKKPTMKVYCKAEPNFSLTLRDGKVILARSNPDDAFQHWYKDEKYSTRVKDEEGFPCFALVNKATGQALKHSVGDTHPVQLIPYNADVLDESILWTESKDVGAGYRAVRMVNNIRLNVDAFHGDEKSGGVHDGTTIVLWQWNKGDNQLWKIVPYCKFLEKQSPSQ
ncbi:hypothetical protein SLE2022_054620 [Rubroshorea leprosula]